MLKKNSSRAKIMTALGLTDKDRGKSVFGNQVEGYVGVEKSPWYLTHWNNSWVGTRLVIRQEWPKAINATFVRGLVSCRLNR